jgi:hypothetical protein
MPECCHGWSVQNEELELSNDDEPEKDAWSLRNKEPLFVCIGKRRERENLGG